MSLRYVVNFFSARVVGQALLNCKTVFILALEGERYVFSLCGRSHSSSGT